MTQVEALEQGLKDIEQMLNQLDQARACLPLVLRSLAIDPSTASLKRQDGDDGLATIRASMKSSQDVLTALQNTATEHQDLIKQARASFEASKDDVHVRKRTKTFHFDLNPSAQRGTVTLAEYQPLTAPSEMAGQSFSDVLERYRPLFPHLTVMDATAVDSHGLLRVEVDKTLQAYLLLSGPDRQHVENVTCLSMSEKGGYHSQSAYKVFQFASTACLEAIQRSAAKTSNLEHILSLLNSYHTLFTSPCAKCAKLMSENQVPAAWRAYIKQDQSTSSWTAYHRTCWQQSRPL